MCYAIYLFEMLYSFPFKIFLRASQVVGMVGISREALLPVKLTRNFSITTQLLG